MAEYKPNQDNKIELPLPTLKLDQDEELKDQTLHMSPSKAEYLAKLTAGLNHGGKSRSQLSNQAKEQLISAVQAPQDGGEQSPQGTRNHRNDHRSMTQREFGRNESPNKQSVLVKRVMRDGRVVSGLDSFNGPIDKLRSEPYDEDQGTLGSQNAMSVGNNNNNNTVAGRESNVVNYATNEGSQSRMRSTMYITGKSQKFALNANRAVRKNAQLSDSHSPIGKTMIINLGDRTQTNFGNARGSGMKNDIDMLVGVQDIVTGDSHIQHPSKNNLNPKLRPKKDFGKRADSLNNRGSSTDLVGRPNMQTSGAQVEGSVFQTPSVTPQLKIQTDRNLNTSRNEKLPMPDVDPMQILSLSPTMKMRNNGNLPEAQITEISSLNTSQQPIIQMMGQLPIGNHFQKQVLTGIAVTNVDAMSMIPMQPSRDTTRNSKSPRLRAKHMSFQTNDRIQVQMVTKNKKNEKISNPKQALNGDLKHFHKAQAMQYKEFMRNHGGNESQKKGPQTNIGRREYGHQDQSQSTLMDLIVQEDTDRLDGSIEPKPGQMNQGTQPSEIMMQSLEDQLNILKQATNDSFYVPNPIHQNQDATSPAYTANQAVLVEKLLETVRSGQTDMLPYTTKNNATANATHEQFKLTARNGDINSKMLSTYRGNDNMKFKIIDQSVLKTYGGSNTSSKRQMLTNTLPIEQVNITQVIPEEEEMRRQSFVYEMKQMQDMYSSPDKNYQPERQHLSPFESQVMSKASPLSKIESFRALLRQESAQNDQLICQNQDNFRNLINPEVTRKDYTILGKSPSKANINMSNIQNQKLLMKKENMLHTVTDEFLQDSYPTTRHVTRTMPVKAQRIAIDPSEFRAKLQKKIDELRLLEVSESQIIKEIHDSREDSSRGFALPNGRLSIERESLDNSLFMTFLQHSNKNNAGFNTREIESSKQLLTKQHTKDLDKIDSAVTGQTRNQYHHVTAFDNQGTMPQISSEKVLVLAGTADSQVGSQNSRQAPFKVENDMMSFADRNLASQSSNPHKRSGVTLASSGSSKTIKRIAKRYQREQRIVIFEDGAEISAKSPCLVIELNSLLFKHYIQQKGNSKFTTQQEDITAQIKMYERAVREILDQCGSRLFIDTELTAEKKSELKGAAPKRFNTLYNVYGEAITSLIQIDEDTSILVAGDKHLFNGLKTNELFRTEEAAQNMLNRIVDQSPINFDQRSTLSPSASMSAKKSPFNKHQTLDSPGKTFALTQNTVGIELPSPTKKSLLSNINQSHRRYQSLTSREIIKASKQELLEQLMTPKHKLKNNGGSSMRTKRLAQITMVTKNIKKGKLPPIKTPQQLDVFVFGEKPSSVMLKQQLLDKSRGQITGPSPSNSRVKRTMTIVETDYIKEGTKDHSAQLLVTEEQVRDFKAKRVTQVQQMASGQSLLNQIRQDGSITSIVPDSSIAHVDIAEEREIESQAATADNEDMVRMSLRKELQNMHSIQHIEQRLGSSRTYLTQRNDSASDPNERISTKNINVARLALKERSPSYLNHKLVSQTSLQDQPTRAKVTKKLTNQQKDKIKADVNEHVLQNALRQRESWRGEYNLDDKQLYSLFSEFSSMMQISRMQSNDAAAGSLKNEMAKRNMMIGNIDSSMNELFPIGSNMSSLQFNKLQKQQAHKDFKLKQNDLKDFKVPVQILIDYAEVLRPTKIKLRSIVMSACGIIVNHKQARVTYEQYLLLNSFIRYNNGSDDDHIWFCVKLFDPQLTGFAYVSDCEAIIDLLFDNQDEDGKTTKPPEVKLPESKNDSEVEAQIDIASSAGEDVVADEKSVKGSDHQSINDRLEETNVDKPDTAQAITERDGTASALGSKDSKGSKRAKQKAQAEDNDGKDESVAANIKKVCHDQGVFKLDSFLEPNLLFETFKKGLLDVEDFKSALK